MQKVKHKSANPRAILDRGGDAFGEGRLCLLATSRAAAAMSTVLCDNQGLWLGQIYPPLAGWFWGDFETCRQVSAPLRRFPMQIRLQALRVGDR